MEFILFLAAKEKEILELLYKANYSIEENTPLCLLGDKYFGFLKKGQRKVVICTENAKTMSGYTRRSRNQEDALRKTKIIIRRAVRHEATHVAQACNNSKTVNLIDKNRKIHDWYKKKSLKASTSVGSGSQEREYEAYLMEERPKLVIKALRKYCL